MPFLLPALPAIISGVGGLIGGLGNSAGARTGTSSGTQNTTQNGTTTPTYTPGQTALQQQLESTISNEATNGINIKPGLTSGTNDINTTYKGIGDRLQQQLSSRGFGSGGASGSTALQTELGRGGAVGNLQSQLQQYAIGQQQNAIGQGLQAAFANPGKTTSDTSSGTQSGTYTNPGSTSAGTLAGLFGGAAGGGLLKQLGGLGGSGSGGGDLGNGQTDLGD